MAASKNKKLKKDELDFFKNKLLKLRSQISGDISTLGSDYLKKNAKDATGDLSAAPFHMADQGTDTFDTDFNLGLISNEQDVLLEIDEALKKIEAGNYGVCEKYNVPISKQRLKVMPYARYCIKAQEEEEKKSRR